MGYWFYYSVVPSSSKLFFNNPPHIRRLSDIRPLIHSASGSWSTWRGLLPITITCDVHFALTDGNKILLEDNTCNVIHYTIYVKPFLLTDFQNIYKKLITIHRWMQLNALGLWWCQRTLKVPKSLDVDNNSMQTPLDNKSKFLK